MFGKASLKIILFSAAAFAAAILPCASASAYVCDWGVSFQKSGETPVGNKSADYLKKFGAYYAAGPGAKNIYLTFDAGYENGFTGPILDVLKKNNVPATFFLVGDYIKRNPELVKRMLDEGHIVGNHTMRHKDMTQLNEADFAAELSKNAELFKSVTGRDMGMYYRPPAGRFNEENLAQAKSLGYKTILWSLAYRDYDRENQPSKETAFSKLVPRIHPGSIILLHNMSRTNATILEELIGRYRQMGYEFRSLDQIQ